jgi:hypothetical protein
MGDFFESVKKVGAYAADKTGDAVEIGVAKGKIAARKSDIADIEKLIGRYFYKKYLENGVGEDEAVLEHCKKIDSLNSEIAELEAQIFATKNEE